MTQTSVYRTVAKCRLPGATTTGDTMDEYKPDHAVHPAHTLRETLLAKDIKTHTELARLSGLSEAVCAGLTHGWLSVTEKEAPSLERVLGVPAEFWLRLEANWKRDVREAKLDMACRRLVADCQELGIRVDLDELLEWFNKHNNGGGTAPKPPTAVETNKTEPR